ncbi:MAG: hypothetical protein DME17_18770, partial [Candidatus Rokuibacteriota bacterium]
MILVLLALFLVAPAPAQTRDPTGILRAMEDAFASVADHAMPAVVNVTTTPRKTPTAGGSGHEPSERFREFFGPEFYDRFFKR